MKNPDSKMIEKAKVVFRNKTTKTRPRLLMKVDLTDLLEAKAFVRSCLMGYNNVNIPFLAHSISEYGRYPLEVYPFWMRFVLLVIVPSGFIGYVPALIMRGFWPLQLTLALVAMTILYFLAARMFFYRGIKKYESMGM